MTVQDKWIYLGKLGNELEKERSRKIGIRSYGLSTPLDRMEMTPERIRRSSLISLLVKSMNILDSQVLEGKLVSTIQGLL